MRTIAYIGGTCRKCKKLFVKHVHNQVFCGSKQSKTGCSYLNMSENKKLYARQPKMKKYHRLYDSVWRKEQRKNNTPYYQRQMVAASKYRIKNLGKIRELNKLWRSKNKLYVLAKNKARRLSNASVFPLQDWADKKEKTVACLGCGIRRHEMLKKYGSQFSDFTIDHFIPISKGGTNEIENLRPICVGCNSRKRDRKPIVGYLGATMDLFHVGHVQILQKAKSLCDFLIVALNSDSFVLQSKRRYPVMTLKERLLVVESMWAVDQVVVNDSWDSKILLDKYKPDLIFVGDDYTHERFLKQMTLTDEWLSKNDMDIVYLPYTKGISTTEIIQRIKLQ